MIHKFFELAIVLQSSVSSQASISYLLCVFDSHQSFSALYRKEICETSKHCTVLSENAGGRVIVPMQCSWENIVPKIQQAIIDLGQISRLDDWKKVQYTTKIVVWDDWEVAFTG